MTWINIPLLKTQFTIRKGDVNIKELISWKPKDDPKHVKGRKSSVLETSIKKKKIVQNLLCGFYTCKYG